MENNIDVNSPQWRNLQKLLHKSAGPRHKQVKIKKMRNGTKLYSCMVCQMKYDDKGKMEHHLCMHNDEYRYICDICGTGLKRREHLDRHTLEHEEVRPHICGDCGKAFKRKEHLNIHEAIHTNHRTQVCHICNRSFHRRDHLNKHMITHVRRDESMQVDHENIPITQEADIETENLSIPIQVEDEKESLMNLLGLTPTVPVNPQRPYQCVVCFKTYKRKDHLKLHLFTHQKKNKMCQYCCRAFHKDEEVQAHIRLDHHIDLKIEPIIPENCEKNKSNATFECPHCEKKFTRNCNLQLHISNNHKTLECGMCGQELTQMEIANHECNMELTNDEPYDDCDIDIKPEIDLTVEEDSLLVPRDAIPYNSYVVAAQKMFTCKVCAKKFRRKDHYKIHLNIHTGIKSFFCPDCGKGFYRKDHLQKHSQVHFKPNTVKNTKKAKKPLPDLKPISMVPKSESKLTVTEVTAPKTPVTQPVIPEITITAPSSRSLNSLQIKVPYKVVMSTGNGQVECRTVTPQTSVYNS